MREPPCLRLRHARTLSPLRTASAPHLLAASARLLLAASAVSVLGASTARGRTWHVGPDGSGDAPTIQAGIDSARAGDDVLLAPGVYSWTSQEATGHSMIYMKPGVTLHSEGGAQATVIDAESQGRVLICENAGGQVRIEGLTIERGLAPESEQPFSGAPGGGVYADANSNPTISNCIIRDNLVRSWGRGGGIACDGAAAILDCEIVGNGNRDDGGLDSGGCAGGGLFMHSGLVQNCSIHNNGLGGENYCEGGGIVSGGKIIDCAIEENGTAAYWGSGGGGVVLNDGASLIRCAIIKNSAVSGSGGFPFGGGVLSMGTGCTITDCVFLGNVEGGLGGGILVMYQATITGCTFVGNMARPPYPPGSDIRVLANSSATVRSCIIAFSAGVICLGNVTFECTNLYDNRLGDAICGADGRGNFSADPQFCAVDPVASRSVALQEDSPCAPGNHPEGTSCGLLGAAPVGCGPVSVEELTWSPLKGRYR